MTILGISGSLRRDSRNTRALRTAAGRRRGGVALEIWEGLKAIPPYDEDDDGPAAPAAVAELRSAIAGADAVLFATPEYNASIPGQREERLDWSLPLATNELRNKPVAVIGASTGMFGAVWSQAELGRCARRSAPGSSRTASRSRARPAVSTSTARWSTSSSCAPSFELCSASSSASARSLRRPKPRP